VELTVPLEGPAGEPIDLWRTLQSHGVAHLPPMELDEDAAAVRTTIALPRARPRTLVIEEQAGAARVRVLGPKLAPRSRPDREAAVRRLLNLDEDLSPFYAVAVNDPDLGWAAAGAGRMLRSPTVFEDVVKTICTTNCAWSATIRMTTALVEHLGEASAGRHGHAFPTPAAMADADDGFYRDVARAGYRGAYLGTLARAVASGEVDLEELLDDALPDGELEGRLRGLPGIGPYAAAHVMMLLGRYSSLVLDSWTRPKYAQLVGRKSVPDSTIVRRFRRYGRYAGLAFWLFLTRDWVADPIEEAPARLSAGEPRARRR
jgi:3-methyladenine DNA glycosylase/8-oxoguanine DNA glycosylase